MKPSLSVLGVGLWLPPAHSVRERVVAAGGDPDGYEGWEHVCIAEGEDHPSTMAAAALERALSEAQIPKSELRLVISAGVSRDYVPSWSMAAEVMRLHDLPSSCIGLDVTLGCVGLISALNLALGWLLLEGGGVAAIVGAERWAHTIDRKSAATKALWAHADGASAMIVGLNTQGRSLAEFQGATFSSNSEYNGLILVKYGGTRFPEPPPGESSFARQLRPVPPREVWQAFSTGYGRAIAALHQRFDFVAHRLICNQTSPKIVRMIGELAAVPEARICVTAHATGHIGSADLMLALRGLIDHGEVDGPIVLASSTPHAFAAGLLLPPRTP